MKPPSRKAKVAAIPVKIEPAKEVEENIPRTGDFFKDNYPDDSDLDEDSEHSDYGKKTSSKRKSKAKGAKTKTPAKKRRRVAREPSLEIPEMSDIDSDGDDREEDLRLFEKKDKQPAPVKATLTPKVLRLEIRSAPTTININLTDLFPKSFLARHKEDVADCDGSTLLEHEDLEQLASQMTDPINMRLNPDYACFLELEPELRNRIYRNMLVADSVVKFNPAPRSSRQPAILRTCKQIHEEGRGILYGENAFHLERINKTRGRYYDNEHREVGYKDARRFVETIGPENMAKVRFLSIDLSDATPTFTPKLEATERRYVNDPILHYLLRLIGKSGCILDKFVVGYVGRGDLDLDDVPFLRAFSSIRCRKLIKTCKFGHSRVSIQLYSKIKTHMQEPELFDVDEARRKEPEMEHEKSGRNYCPYRGAICRDN